MSVGGGRLRNGSPHPPVIFQRCPSERFDAALDMRIFAATQAVF